MSFSPAFSDKVDGQTVTAAELNQLKNQNAQAVDKSGGDNVTGVLTLTQNIAYTPRLRDRERIAWTSLVDAITLLPHFGRTTSNLVAATITQFSTVLSNTLHGDILALPHGCTVTEISCNFTPAVGHVALPSVQPSFALRSRPRLGGVAGDLLVASNIQPGIGTYNGANILAVASGAIPIELTTNTYWLEFRGEASLNALPGLLFQGASMKLQITVQDEA